MTTRLYQPTTPGAVNPIANGTWGVPLGSTSLMVPYKIGTSMVQDTVSYATGQKAEARVAVSQPMRGPGIISGTLRAYALALSPAAANARAQLELYVVSKDGSVLRGTLLSIADYSTGTGFNTTLRNKAWADGDALTPVTYRDQDRIIAKWGLADVSGTTPQVTLQFGDGTSSSTDVGQNETDTSAALASWLELSQSIDFYGTQINNLASSSQSGTSVTSFTLTPSSIPSGNAVQILAVWSGSGLVNQGIIPTVSGGGFANWVQIASTLAGGPGFSNAARLTLFRAMAASPTGGAITISFGAAQSKPTAQWVEVTGVDTSGADGAGAVGPNAVNTQNGSGIASPFSVSFGSPSTHPDNLCLAFYSTGTTTPTSTPTSGWATRLNTTFDTTCAALLMASGAYQQSAGVTFSGTLNVALIDILEINTATSASNPPTVTRVSPAPGAVASPTTPLVLDALDVDNDLSIVVINASYPTLGASEPIFDGTAFLSPWLASSTEGAVTHGSRFTLLRTGGLPDAGGVTLSGFATDSFGNVVPFSIAWTSVVFPAPPPPTPVAVAVVESTLPARDILVDEDTRDFALTAGGDLSLVGAVPSIVQAIRQALRTFLGEWFLDDTVGVPWFQQILVKAPSLPAARAVIRAAILAVPGVLDVTSIELNLNKTTRNLSVTFAATSDVGELTETINVPGREAP